MATQSSRSANHAQQGASRRNGSHAMQRASRPGTDHAKQRASRPGNDHAKQGASRPGTDHAKQGASRPGTQTDQLRALNERVIDSVESAGIVYLDAYESALMSVDDLEHRLAAPSQTEWLVRVARAQAAFARDVTAAYSSAARTLLI